MHLFVICEAADYFYPSLVGKDFIFFFFFCFLVPHLFSLNLFSFFQGLAQYEIQKSDNVSELFKLKSGKLFMFLSLSLLSPPSLSFSILSPFSNYLPTTHQFQTISSEDTADQKGLPTLKSSSVSSFPVLPCLQILAALRRSILLMEALFVTFLLRQGLLLNLVKESRIPLPNRESKF